MRPVRRSAARLRARDAVAENTDRCEHRPLIRLRIRQHHGAKRKLADYRDVLETLFCGGHGSGSRGVLTRCNQTTSCEWRPAPHATTDTDLSAGDAQHREVGGVVRAMSARMPFTRELEPMRCLSHVSRSSADPPTPSAISRRASSRCWA